MEPTEEEKEEKKKDRSTQTPPLSLPPSPLSRRRRLFDSPETDDGEQGGNYGKNETDGKNDEGGEKAGRVNNEKPMNLPKRLLAGQWCGQGDILDVTMGQPQATFSARRSNQGHR